MILKGHKCHSNLQNIQYISEANLSKSSWSDLSELGCLAPAVTNRHVGFPQENTDRQALQQEAKFQHSTVGRKAAGDIYAQWGMKYTEWTRPIIHHPTSSKTKAKPLLVEGFQLESYASKTKRANSQAVRFHSRTRKSFYLLVTREKVDISTLWSSHSRARQLLQNLKKLKG